MEVSVRASPSGYRLRDTLHLGSVTAVYRAERERDQQPVILKMLVREMATPGAIARFRHELEILEHLRIPGVVELLDMEVERGLPMLVFADTGCRSLAQLYGGRPLPVEQVSSLGARIAESLGRVHEHGIIHRDINPTNILFNPDSQVLEIADFGWSTWRENVTHQEQASGGTLAYSSPEQTGRMNRVVDHRTDLYALGVTLYELATGRLPFVTEDRLALMHSHIARRPTPVHELDPGIPEMFSEIVDKLMAKMPDERYQSAQGCAHDLRECQRRLRETGTIERFVLGLQDHPTSFHLAPAIYGRQHERAVIRELFDQVKRGQRGLLLVSGTAGIGKTALIHEVGTALVSEDGYFASGKYEPHHENIPYSAVAQAFGGLIRQILTEPDHRLESWRDALREALAPNARVLVDVLPELAYLIGPQAPVPELGPVAAENRFNHVFQQFLRVICRREHPLIVFLDNLQWADASSLRLVKLMANATDIAHLLIIGSYRENELGEDHPLTALVSEPGADGLGSARHDLIGERIALEPLSFEDMNRLFADTLHCEMEECADLARAVLAKTGGNPFFVNQFGRVLSEDGLLAFDRARHRWSWDLEAIEGLGITDNLVALMLERARQLPAPTPQMLELAACVGSSFDVATLAIVSERAPGAVREALAPALAVGLLRRQAPGVVLVRDGFRGDRGGYAFSHDRLQQAIYHGIPEERRGALHLRIARLLAREERDRRIFEIAEHMTLATPPVDEASALEHARLCLAAGQRAEQTLAHESALRFLRAGLRRMPADGWDAHYPLMRDLALATLEVEYLDAGGEHAHRLADEILAHARDMDDKVAVRELQIRYHTARSEMAEALALGYEALAMLDFELPREPAAAQARIDDLHERILEHARGVESPENLPELRDPRQARILRLLTRAGPAAFFTEPLLGRLFNAASVDLCMRHGHSSGAAVPYIDFAAHLCGTLQELELGHRFGTLALHVLEAYPDAAHEVRVGLTFHALVGPWSEPMRASLAPLAALFQRGLHTGDLEFAFYCAWWHAFIRLAHGDALGDVYRELCAYHTQAERHHLVLHQNFFALWKHLCERLTGQPAHTEPPVALPVPFVQLFEHVAATIVHLVMGEYQAAAEAARRAEDNAHPGPGLLIMAEYRFFHALALLAALPTEAEPERAQAVLAQVAGDHALIRRWAERVPENHGHRYAFLEAERARIAGDAQAAIARYDEALERAQAHGHVRDQALVCERAACFHQERGHRQIARMYRMEAWRAYQRWGAHAKLQRLREEHPEVPSHAARPSSSSSSGTASERDRSFDLESVVRASQALSSQLVLDELAAELMKIIIENAGAQRGYLLFLEHGGLVIVAEGDIDTGHYRAVPSWSPDDERAQLAGTVVNYVTRTQESALASSPEDQEPFAHDPYVRAYQPRSILCAPIARHGQLVGVIYLENNLTWDAFTPARVELVQILATQAAISIENARLMSDLEASKRQAEEASRAKSEFLANVNHELRTPMNGIIGTIELLHGTDVDEQQQHYLDVARTSAEQLMRIISDTLDLSRIEAGKLELDPVRFSLADCVDTLERMLSASIRMQGLHLELDIAADVPAHLVGDRNRLLQILINLLGNAIKFTPAGGALALRVAVLERSEDTVVLRFDVRDTGVGIAAAELERIFQPFSQTRIPGAIGGTGLGLSIVSNLVSLMHGEISVKSVLGEGSEFSFTAEFGVWQSEPMDEPDTEERPTEARGLRLLLVEDNSINQLVAVRLLATLGHECTVADHGADALRVLEGQSFDAVLMDVHMPIMDGYVTTREIRRREEESGGHLPIIAITASATTDVVEACKSSGMDHYLSKPLRLDAVREILESIRP